MHSLIRDGSLPVGREHYQRASCGLKTGTARELPPGGRDLLARYLEKRSASGNFFGNRTIFFPDPVEFGLAARRADRDNQGYELRMERVSNLLVRVLWPDDSGCGVW